MRALQLNGPNKKFQLMELPTPIPKISERLIKIESASLNHRDLWIQKGQYANLKYPIVLGSDGCGLDVTEESDHSRSHIVICPTVNWGNTERHQSENFKVIGLPDQGTFAEYICVPQQNVFSKPEHLTVAEASSLPVAGLTAYRALFTRGELKAHETVLITGIGGGAAHLALLFATSIGAKVFVTSSSDEKIKMATQMGATGGVKYTDPNWVTDLQNMSNGFDVIVDSAAGSGFGKLVELAKPGGRIVFFGATQGVIDSIDPRKVFWNQISILGTSLGSPIDFGLMLHHVDKYKITPSITEFQFFEINEALDLMDRGLHFGKITLRW